MTRECLRAVVDTSIPGRRVVRELCGLSAQRGAPKVIDSDNGSELASERGAGLVGARPASSGTTLCREADAERVRQELQWSHAQ